MFWVLNRHVRSTRRHDRTSQRNSYFRWKLKGLIVQAGVWKEIKLSFGVLCGCRCIIPWIFSTLWRVLCRTPFRPRVFRAFGVSSGVLLSRPAPDTNEQLGGTVGAAGWLTDLFTLNTFSLDISACALGTVGLLAGSVGAVRNLSVWLASKAFSLDESAGASGIGTWTWYFSLIGVHSGLICVYVNLYLNTGDHQLSFS